MSPIVLAALFGACLGFIPYNMNPAKIFMGDTGATFLGYILATLSVTGLFKMYAIISFAVPFLILGVPIFDICFAFLRRMAKGQNPMNADRGHVHHRLIDMGFSQKQAVAISYMLAAILGLAAVLLTSSGELKALILIGAIFVVGAIGMRADLSARGGADAGAAARNEPQSAGRCVFRVAGGNTCRKLKSCPSSAHGRRPSRWPRWSRSSSAATKSKPTSA